MFTEQLIRGDQSLFHLVLALQRVQMLGDVHVRQLSAHFLHAFASVGETKYGGRDTAPDGRRTPVSRALPCSR